MVTMETADSKECEGIDKKVRTKFSRMPLYRQIFVCSGVTSYFFIYGLFMGAPTVYIPQIRREANSTEAISMSTASWLSSLSSYSAAPWTIILTVLAQYFGRKLPYTILWFVTVAAALLLYFSTSVIELIISGIFQGVLSAVVLTVSIMILTEYKSARYRGIFMTFKTATVYWGIWVSNVIGMFFNWKYIAVLIIICCVFNISTVFWPESPYWLATKGRFTESATCHKWLKGDDDTSREEFKDLIFCQKRKLKKTNKCDTINKSHKLIKFYRILTSRKFYKPIIFAMVNVCLYYSSGKLSCAVYAIDIIKKITESESTAYQGMLILDGITVLGMYIGCILSKFLKRRTLLLVSSSIGVSCLFILSLYLYLVKLNIILENKYISITLLTFFSVTISCGPLIMTMCLSGEFAPLKYRNLYLSVFGLFTNIVMATALKITPYIFNGFGSHGAFLFYGLSASVFIIILYIHLPETKDKTIYEIEKIILGNDYVSNIDNEITADPISLQDYDDLID